MAELPTARGTIHAQKRAAAACADAESILDLARAAARGDDRAIGVLYERRFATVFQAARAATGRDEHFCLDVVQECFLRVLRAAPALARLKDADHVDRWLVRVAQSSALDLLRAEQRRSRRERLAARARPTGVLEELIARLDADLSRLSSQERDLLRLRASGLTLHGIAEMVGTTIGTVHGRLRRLTAAMRTAQREAEHE